MSKSYKNKVNIRMPKNTPIVINDEQKGKIIITHQSKTECLLFLIFKNEYNKSGCPATDNKPAGQNGKKAKDRDTPVIIKGLLILLSKK